MEEDIYKFSSAANNKDSNIGMFSNRVESLIQSELRLFEQSVSITEYNHIPDTSVIPIENPQHWIKVKDIICCFVDMEGSTKLSAGRQDRFMAKAYRLFTETAIRIFVGFDAKYIDVKGDGVFALFDRNKVHTALAATVSFKTFVKEYFTPKIKKLTELEIGGHFGIDQKTVLVRKFGLKRHNSRTDRQNEVWAGKPINMSAKLASQSTNNELWVSERYFNKLTDDKAKLSCGCPSGGLNNLWEERDVSYDTRFDFNSAYVLKSNWCKEHGKSFSWALKKIEQE